MLRSVFGARVLAALFVAALAAPLASAQERGENINGFITDVNGRNVVVKNDDGREIRIRVTPSTEVYFQDSGDRKLFPNPTIADLRTGMGVHFNYNDGTPDRVVVHFVPEGFVRQPAASSEQVRARIESIDRLGRDITVRADGRTRTYDLENRGDARGFRAGDMVMLTVRDDGQRAVVTRIEAVDGGGAGDVTVRNGVITRIVARNRSVTIDVNGREEVYEVDNAKLLDDAHVGDRVRFEVEERTGGRRVITAMERRR
jgi:hypothetical protein